MSGAPQPASGAPQRAVLEGRYARLEPLALQHTADLYAAGAASPERFRWLFQGAPADQETLAEWIAEVATGDDPLYFAVVDRLTGRCEGRQAFMRTAIEHGSTEIGGIYWGPAIARTRVATEALYLFARHAFDDLGFRRFEWKCNDRNAPSKRAALRFGFTFEGVFRQHMIIKGENRDTAWFSIIDTEWPRLRAGYERWLAPENFDDAGTQREKLSF